jgi:effector-binding domain-containing protein
LKIDPNIFDFRVCLPVAIDFTPTGRVQSGQMFAMKIARTIYRGPYERLGLAWGEFGKWLKEQRHTPGDDFWERYLKGPEKSDDPAEWETELNRPIAP